MKVLVIGSGGREHALVWKLAQSPLVETIFCAPGNAGIERLATLVPIAADDVKGLARFAQRERIDLTVVGPEAPLTMGIVDLFAARGLAIFGPSKAAAMLEGSKAFAKALMAKYNIPTGGSRVFRSLEAALRHVERERLPMVVKADGLAAGKGVMVCHDRQEARAAVRQIMEAKAFGAAGSRLVVEEFLPGEEASFLAFTDGTTVLPLPSAQDHKAILEGDRGPNTGGMGAYSPAPVLTPAVSQRVLDEIMIPTVRAMAAEGHPYKGVLYAGLMINGDSVKVLEFNCRFGDPEAQPLLMRLKTDLAAILLAVVEERLSGIELDIDPRPAVCVVMAAGGYPGPYQKGKRISGLAEAGRLPDVQVFHAGTARRGRITVTAGGRVLGVTATGDSLRQAIRQAYAAVDLISWEGCQLRRDIGAKALARERAHAPRVGIVLGSDSDLPVMEASLAVLAELDIPCEITVASAHRSPARAAAYAGSARERGLAVLIAAAGMAAHLAGVLAAHTTLPVIGVPIDSGSLQGLDALLSTVQMPPGVPVACMAIGKAGARNAAVLAAQILAVGDASLAARLAAAKEAMAQAVAAKAAQVAARALGPPPGP
ncbi:MAG: phosphoribosylamine--glycine ligase [Thermodesulfobacteriota bacterium]